MVTLRRMFGSHDATRCVGLEHAVMDLLSTGGVTKVR